MSGASSANPSIAPHATDSTTEDQGSAWGSSYSPYEHQPSMVAHGCAEAHNDPNSQHQFVPLFSTPEHHANGFNRTSPHDNNEEKSPFHTQINGQHFMVD